jgi:integrase
MRGSVIVPDPRTGGQVRRYVSAPTRAAVVRKMDKIKKDAESGTLTTGITTADYLASWLELERTRVRPSTWRQREQVVRTRLNTAIGAIPLAKLSPTDVERMTTAIITSGRAPRTAAATRVILRRALGDALRDGLVRRNVASLARPPRVPSRDLMAGRDYLDLPDLRRLLEAGSDPGDEEHPPSPIGPLVIVAATTGLRQGELLGLAWPDVSIGSRTLTVRRSLARSYGPKGWDLAEPKTAASRRTVNLPAAAVAALEAQRTRQDAAEEAVGSAWQNVDDLVFTDSVGSPQRGYTVTRTFHELLTSAGLPSVPFHALRHTAATTMLSAGVPLAVISRTLGHSTISITADIYAAVVPELRREASDAMDRVLG